MELSLRSQKTINVVIWEEWLCDPRIKELKKGQRLILFLEKLPNGSFYPVNESTGELYVDNNSFPNIFLPKDFSNPTVLKKGIAMFLETYTFYGNFNDRFYQNIHCVRYKSIFEVYKIAKTNTAFKFLVDNAEYFEPTEVQQFFY
ncbi:hypothetical protein SAMN05216297_11491 [Flavobacterium phragmitis]|uniref:Uncharacterized protein n=2 Tax=Flavobacterium phragmitis TaxID=739143 RepID=A0A1I1W5K6_9FLAO|nr:hypothetical protein SAMN05216297_11491 [Flavobacterium phragmitis]